MQDKKTKIIATIGPACDSSIKIKQLITSGVNLFRFNTKHSDVDWHNQRIKKVQKIADKLGVCIGIIVDLQGNEIRIQTRNEKTIKVKKNQELIISNSFLTKEASLVISDNNVFKKIKEKDTILIDDGLVELKIIEKTKNYISVKVIDGGDIKNRKSVNLPGSKIKLSSLIKRDIENLDSAAKNKVTFIALSFVTSKKDILIIRQEMKKRNMAAGVISKIENEQSIKKIDEIIDASDAIMIARGDLGIEMPIEKLAYWQKEIINKCRIKNKPVIVATQMLHSMIKNTRPTRAEATDVANSVFDGSDAVMLSEETAIGKHPLKAVNEMARIISFNEKKAISRKIEKENLNPAQFVIQSIVKKIDNELINNTKIKTAIVLTESGYTSNVLSSFRLKIKVIAITNTRKTAEKLTLSYGVNPHYTSINFNNLEINPETLKNLKLKNLIKKNEIIAIFHGRYNKKPSLLNLFSLTRIN